MWKNELGSLRKDLVLIYSFKSLKMTMSFYSRLPNIRSRVKIQAILGNAF